MSLILSIISMFIVFFIINLLGKVDKEVWDDFLRLCSNSSYDRKTIVTQALYDFMKNHKDLL